jgi:hypothetical protein
MTNLRLVDANSAECPACNQSCSVISYHPDRSGMWQHYFGKRCSKFRKSSDKVFPNGDAMLLLIKQAHNTAKKQNRELIAAQKQEEQDNKKAYTASIHRKHTVSGGFLMDVVSELESAMSMMEAYYSQCDADEDGRDMVRKLQAIIDSKD